MEKLPQEQPKLKMGDLAKFVFEKAAKELENSRIYGGSNFDKSS
jgi:hypothetical protein